MLTFFTAICATQFRTFEGRVETDDYRYIRSSQPIIDLSLGQTDYPSLRAHVGYQRCRQPNSRWGNGNLVISQESSLRFVYVQDGPSLSSALGFSPPSPCRRIVETSHAHPSRFITVQWAAPRSIGSRCSDTVL